MKESLIAAEKECEWIALNSKDELRPIGDIYTEICDPIANTTDLKKQEYTWKVVSHEKIFKYRRGNEAFFAWGACIKCIGILDID